MEDEFNFKEKIEYKLIKNKKEVGDKRKIKIFNEEFVKNNESNFKIIYKDEEFNLLTFLEISKDKTSNIVNIILKQINKITDISKMFMECEELYSCSGLSKLNIENVTDISHLFRNCKNILKLPDISKWNTSNVNNMSYLFSGCNSLYSLPEISNWNTSKVTDVSSMFFGCSNLSKLPDISNWNTSNIKNMNKMFQGCSKLVDLPDISKWDVSTVTNMSFMFYGCILISNLPDISVWNTKKVVNMSSMFFLCSGLDKLPELDKWNVSNLKKYSSMFSMCKSTLNIPAFSKFGVQNISPNIQVNIHQTETNKNPEIKKVNIKSSFNPESLESFLSKNYLCCPKCKGIPEIILKNNGIALLFCDFCCFSELVKFNDIINISSKWIKRVFYKCNIHNNNDKNYIYKYCRICELFLCEECENIHNHKNGEEHELEYIGDIDINICEKHSSKTIKFCETCNSYTCNICMENEHKSHRTSSNNKNDKFNINILKNYYLKLENGKRSKISILDKIAQNFNDDEVDIRYKILQLFKQDLKEIEDYKKLGKIIYFSSRKIKKGEKEEGIITNYLNLFEYICSQFNKENLEKFRKSVETKIHEFKIISNGISKQEHNIMSENIKNIFEPIPPKVSDFNKKKAFIENNIEFSRILKKYLFIEKNKNPDNYIDMDEILNDLNKVTDGVNSYAPNNSDFILSIIGKCAQNNGTEIYISKKSSEEYENLESASIQSLFSLGTLTKYELHFNFGEEENEKILNSHEEQEKFIKKYKHKIASELKIDINNLIFKDIHRGSLGVSCLQIEEKDSDKSIQDLEGKFNIEKIEEKPLLEALQISPDILDPEGNRFFGWGIDEKRGGEDYKPPLNNWRGYGLKVKGKYDRKNDDWLSYENKKGEFAIAYIGINNFLGESSKMISDINVYTTKLKYVEKNKLYRKDSNCRKNSGHYKLCGDGICLFQNPEYAENSAGIININGYQVKVILMCRVNPKKIRQPENFKDCWILNPTPDEIRPYRILIKIVPNSPLTDGSFLTVSYSPEDYIIEIFKSKDCSFFKHRGEKKYEKYYTINKQPVNDDIFVVRIYTDVFYQCINGYLRDKTFYKNFPSSEKLFPSKDIKSVIFCLQNSIKNNANVEENITVYRGIKIYKFPKDIGIGSEFYFREFISTSRKKEEARRFTLSNGKGTLLIIKLKNLNKRNYCFDIANFSLKKEESEILLSSYCSFVVTGIERHDIGIDIVNLDCKGFLLDDLIEEKPSKK